MKVTELLMRAIENEGTKYVFGVPGEEIEDLLFSIHDSSVEFVPTRHEQGAAFMANVWGRLTGTAGVALATLGPGATNLLTGVADANLDRAPVVAITGQGGMSRSHHESHQYVDVVGMFRPVTKWNTAISHTSVVPEVVRKAFKVAQMEKPGATHIELSEDIASQDATGLLEPIPPRRVRRPGPDYKAIDMTMDLLREAERPLILAGNGAIRKRASKHLNLLVERTDIPVVSTYMGKGAISDADPRSLMSTGLGPVKDHVMEAMDQADLVITVGYDVAELAPKKWNPEGDKRIVHIDFDPAEVYSHYVPDVEVVGDISGALWEINQHLDGQQVRFDTEWFEDARQHIWDDIKSWDLEEGKAFTVPGVLNVIRDVLGDDGLLISDVGAHKIWIARNFPTYRPNGCIISNGLASMGISLPGGIAASLVDPERQVVAAMGDGGFLMNSQELETAKRMGVGFTAVVFNDNNYGLIKWNQESHRGSSVGVELGNPDIRAYAETFGVAGYRPESLSELRETLGETLASGELAVVEVPVDNSVNNQLRASMEAHGRRSA